ncbi:MULTISPECIES: FAD binding domain-containing protein [Inquilinus]|uniref:CO/xanthine dehydrogenase FAD-binding subunit n=1 Tax=Inquilinus ginsengisoli TaxID=363840 RepID=A0ABU1JNP4_9PROT|nr:FAD binding domain-containing protein [Inquilinus ginsengisoli]MDR6290240.1 CO/xanthine dehydrogenase FAD-binding subunit [Inquilinus ginsengisoli]
MDIGTITTVRRPHSAEDIANWRPSYAWLAGGTWLFSEPQPDTDTLIDLHGLGWPELEAGPDGLTIGATCRIATLYRFAAPEAWAAAPLFRACCEAFLAGFKIWNVSTVGGNLCMSLPAGPMISLTAALDGICTLWPRGGAPRQVAVTDFVTGNHANILGPGELLRSIHLSAAALSRRAAMRAVSLTKLGRSAALVIGTSGDGGDLHLCITAATDRPVHLRFAAMPDAVALQAALDAQVPEARWFADVHGSAPYKRHVVRHLAEEVRRELVDGGRP